MTSLEFNGNEKVTIGAEVEVQLVDHKTFALKSVCPDIIQRIPEQFQSQIKPEFMQSYVEIISGVCETVEELGVDLSEKIRLVEEIADTLDTKVFWGGTHPFSPYYDQSVTESKRYYQLIEDLQELARRLVVFGLHVHVAVDSGDKAVMICERIMRHLPTLLAISSNSPFWGGRDTGLHSIRTKIMESLPIGGLPPLMRNWSEFVWLKTHLIETEFITSINEIWWDVRPHNRFGTIEVRICDIPQNLDDVLGIAAIIHCLVYALSEEIDRGTYQHDCHPMLVQQNKWRACRYGLDAKLVDLDTRKSIPATNMAAHLIDMLKPYSVELGCEKQLNHALGMTRQPTGSVRQLEIFKETGELKEVVRQMSEKTSLLRK